MAVRQLVRRGLWVVGILLLLAARPVTAQSFTITEPSYTITDLGTLGGSKSWAWNLNNSGQVVGLSDTSSGAVHAFLYTGQVMRDLGTLGGTNSEAYGINAWGQVVGYSHPAGDRGWHAFLYSDGVMSDLGTLGGLGSLAYQINDLGQVVGWSNTAAGSGTQAIHAFLYSRGVMSDLGTLGGPMSVAYGINNSGQVVGDSLLSYQAPDGNLADHGFLYSDGVMQAQGDLGRPRSLTFAINASGQSVGCSYTAVPLIYHAFLNSETLHDLGTLGGNASAAFGINTTGQVVGVADTTDGKEHAFLYANGVMVDLNSLLPAGTGWEILEARAINDAGQIVGKGIHNGAQRAFLLTPSPSVIPLPPTLTPPSPAQTLPVPPSLTLPPTPSPSPTQTPAAGASQQPTPVLPSVTVPPAPVSPPPTQTPAAGQQPTVIDLGAVPPGQSAYYSFWGSKDSPDWRWNLFLRIWNQFRFTSQLVVPGFSSPQGLTLFDSLEFSTDGDATLLNWATGAPLRSRDAWQPILLVRGSQPGAFHASLVATITPDGQPPETLNWVFTWTVATQTP